MPDLAQRQADLRGKKRDVSNSVLQFSNPGFMSVHIGEAENAKKADKLNAKKQRKEEPCGDGNGGPLKKPAAKRAAPKAGAKEKVETPKALPKATASPKKNQEAQGCRFCACGITQGEGHEENSSSKASA